MKIVMIRQRNRIIFRRRMRMPVAQFNYDLTARQCIRSNDDAAYKSDLKPGINFGADFEKKNPSNQLPLCFCRIRTGNI